MKQIGFTLIEVMIALVVVGILAAIALPVYQSYSVKTADNACLLEVKGYVNSALVELHESNGLMDPPENGACKTIDQVVDFATDVTARPKSPGTGLITCDMSTSGTCTLTPIN